MLVKLKVAPGLLAVAFEAVAFLHNHCLHRLTHPPLPKSNSDREHRAPAFGCRYPMVSLLAALPQKLRVVSASLKMKMRVKRTKRMTMKTKIKSNITIIVV